MFPIALALLAAPLAAQTDGDARGTSPQEVRLTLAPAEEFAGFRCEVFLVDEEDPLRSAYGSLEYHPATAEAARRTQSLTVDDAEAAGRTVRLIATAAGVRSSGTICSEAFVLGEEPDAVRTVRMPPLGALVLQLNDAAAVTGEGGEVGSVSTVPIELSVPPRVRNFDSYGGRLPDLGAWNGPAVDTWQELRGVFPGSRDIVGLWFGHGFRSGGTPRAVVACLPVGEYWVWYATEGGETVPRRVRVGRHELATFEPGAVRPSRSVTIRPAPGVDRPEAGMLAMAWYRSRVGELLQTSFDFGYGPGFGGTATVPAWAEELVLLHVSRPQEDRLVADLTVHALPQESVDGGLVVEVDPETDRPTAQLPVLPVDAEQWHVTYMLPVSGPVSDHFPARGFDLILPNNHPCTLRGFPAGTYRLVRSVPQGDFRDKNAPPDKVFRERLVIE